MKLYYSPLSPYARKVRVLAIETGLADRIAVEIVSAAPNQPDLPIVRTNPLGKIPALVLEDGTALFDSRVIAEYLDTLHDGPRFHPASGPPRWAALRRQALADGATDAALLARYELALRPADRRWSDWVDGQMAKIRHALDALEAEIGAQDGLATIGDIATACLLGYLDIRFPDETWRAGRPNLTAFDARVAARASMVATRAEP